MTSQSGQQKVIGRPRAFSESNALEAAMRVFWEKGYEGTSISDLTSAMGINRSSLYTIFGDKARLFFKTLERYRAGPASFVWESVDQKTARCTVDFLLRRAVDVLSNPQNPRGCLSVQSALAVGSEAEFIKEAMIVFRKTTEAVLTKRFVRAQINGEITEDLNPGDLARYTLTLLTGLGVQAANGATKQQLVMIVNLALRTLPF